MCSLWLHKGDVGGRGRKRERGSSNHACADPIKSYIGPLKKELFKGDHNTCLLGYPMGKGGSEVRSSQHVIKSELRETLEH